MIGGFIVLGPDPQQVIVRAIGPSLPIAGALPNPFLELHDSNGTTIASNDNWQDQDNDADRQAIIDSGIAPTNDLESALITTLSSNVNGVGYTVVVRDDEGGTGVGLVEVYAISP